MMPVVFPPGVYYVGDLRAVFSEDKWTKLNQQLHPFDPSGCYQLDGLTYYNYWLGASGVWYDTKGTAYPCTGGRIGCVRLSAVEDRSGRTKGQVVDFSEPFICWKDAFCLRFGKEVVINLHGCACRPFCQGDCPDEDTNE